MIYILSLVLAATGSFLPWWGFVAFCFLAGIYSRSRSHAFVSGFGAVTLVWVIYSYYLNMKSHGLMAHRMAEVFV